jgi:hypothetical protein
VRVYVCVEESVYAKVLMRQLNLWCTQKQNNPVEPEVASHSNKIRNVEYLLIQYLHGSSSIQVTLTIACEFVSEALLTEALSLLVLHWPVN